MSWSKVSCGFDVEEETRNFGTRAVALGDEAVFESTTLAVIESSNCESLIPQPWSLSKIHPNFGFTCVLDDSINVFSSNLSELVFSYCFGQRIEYFVWSNNGCFIFIGLQGGALLAVHVPTLTLFKIPVSLNTSSVCSDKHFFVKIKSFCTDTAINIVVVTSTMKIIRIYGSCVDSITQCCNTIDDPAEKRNALTNILSNSIKFDILRSPVFTHSDAVAAEGTPSNSLVIFHADTVEHWFMAGGSLMLIHSAFLEISDKIVQACATTDQRFIVCRLTSGALLFVSMNTFENCWVYENAVVDFSIIGEADCKIMMLVKSEISFDLICYTYPDYKIYFKLPDVSESSIPFGLQDCIYFVEFFGGDVTKTAKIKSIVENDPKSRLQRLLLRGRFEEAEEFCRCFNLSMAETNKYKARKLSDEISVWRKDAFEDSKILQLFETLVSLLDKIEDNNFVFELCFTSVPCKLELIERLLQYTLRRVDKLDAQEIGNSNIYVEKTFNIMKVYKTFIELENIEHSPISWSKFSLSDFFQDCHNYISKGDVRSAIVLCRGYWHEMSSNLSATSAHSLLTLASNLPRSDLFLWLQTYVPLYLTLHEDTFSLFKQWIANIINMLACIEKDIELCNDLVTEVLSILHKTFSDCQYRPFYLPDLTDYIIEMINIFKKLIFLKCEHGVIVPFERMPSSYSKEEKKDFIFSILERVHYDDIEVLVNYFIIPYCCDHSLRCDGIVLNYLKSLKVIGLSDAVWEPRSIKFSKFIFNKSEKMEAVVYILKDARVPWSETISTFEKAQYKASNHFDKIEINNIKRSALIQTFLQKYGILNFNFVSTDYEKMIDIMLYIVDEANFGNQLELFNDIKQLGKIMANDSVMHNAYCYFLCGSLSSGCTLEAIEMLEEEVSEDILTKVYEFCLNQLMDLSDSWIHTSNYKQENVEILFSKIIYKLPKKKLPSNLFEMVTNLKTKFQVEVNAHDMVIESKAALVSSCISQLLSDNRQSCSYSVESTNYIDNLRELILILNVPLWSACFELMSQAVYAKKFDIVAECLRYLTIENTSGNIPVDKVYNIVLQILRQGVPDTFRTMYKDLSSLLKRSSLIGLSSLSSDFVNEMSVCGIVMDLMHKDEFMKPVWYSNSVFIGTISQQPDISQNYLSFIISLLTGTYSVEEYESKYFEDVLLVLDQLPCSLHSISVALRLLITFEVLNSQPGNLNGFISEVGVKNAKAIIMQMLSNALLKIVYSNSFDLNVALNLIYYFPQDKALRWIDNVSFKTEQFRLHNLTLLAQVYCAQFDLQNQLNDYSQSFIISKWNRQFKHHSISFEGIFEDATVKMNILKNLMKLQSFNSNLLNLFCSSFSCNYEDGLLLYLNHILTSWKLNYIIEDDELIIKNKFEDLYDKCRNIALKIEMTPKQLCIYLSKNIWQRINLYYYEVFYVMIKLIKEMDQGSELSELSNYDLLLNFLFSYKRISPLGKKEQEMWDLYDEQQLAELQVISKHRLPFKNLLSDTWNFIAPELSLDNYQDWLILPSWFDVPLSPDLICLFTVKNLQRQSLDNIEGWDLQLKRQDLLSKINKCVNHIENLEIASSALYWAVNNAIPPGADQVEAAQYCLFKACEWKEIEESSKARSCFSKADKKYQSIKIRHILHKYSLAKPEYLNLTTQPCELFRALYNDSSIVDDFSQSGVNDATRIIADTCKMITQLTDIKKEILMKWLTESSSQETDDAEFKQIDTECLDDLKRTVYMIKNEDNSVFMNILFTCVMAHEENTNPVQMKLRALQILLSVLPQQELCRINGTTKQELMEYLETWQFVYDLEQVGIFYAINEFEALPKDKIVLNLLNNPSVCRCIIASELALAYSLKCRNIWNRILSYFISRNLVNQLEKYLVRISKWSRIILDMNILVNAWNTVIKSQIDKDEHSSNFEELTTLFINCPILDKLDFSCFNENIKKRTHSLKYFFLDN